MTAVEITTSTDASAEDHLDPQDKVNMRFNAWEFGADPEGSYKGLTCPECFVLKSSSGRCNCL